MNRREFMSRSIQAIAGLVLVRIIKPAIDSSALAREYFLEGVQKLRSVSRAARGAAEDLSGLGNAMSNVQASLRAVAGCGDVTMDERGITIEEWDAYNWVEVAPSDYPAWISSGPAGQILIRGIDTTFGDSEQRWIRAKAYDEKGE